HRCGRRPDPPRKPPFCRKSRMRGTGSWQRQQPVPAFSSDSYLISPFAWCFGDGYTLAQPPGKCKDILGENSENPNLYATYPSIQREILNFHAEYPTKMQEYSA